MSSYRAPARESTRPRANSLDIVGRVEPHRPYRLTLRRQRDVVAGDHVGPRLDPPAPVAFGTGDADRAVADKVDLAIPLAMPRADRAARIEIAGAVAYRNAVERVRIGGAGTMDDVRGVGHGGALDGGGPLLLLPAKVQESSAQWRYGGGYGAKAASAAAAASAPVKQMCKL